MTSGVKAWSYSAYEMYDRCPLQYKLTKIDKLPVPDPPAFIKGREWHQKAEDYLKGDIEILPVELKNFKSQFEELRELATFIEDEWAFNRDWKKSRWFKDPTTWFRAKCDVGVLYDDNTLDIVDHKTGRKYETNEDQIELFSLAGMFRYPTVTHVTARLWYLEVPGKDGEVIREFDARDRDKLRKKWERKVEPMFNDTRFAPRPNDKCKWCHFRKSNGGLCKHG